MVYVTTIGRINLSSNEAEELFSTISLNALVPAQESYSIIEFVNANSRPMVAFISAEFNHQLILDRNLGIAQYMVQDYDSLISNGEIGERYYYITPEFFDSVFNRAMEFELP
jgi:hypothetical protein